jgi:hypothetical protein
MHVVTPLRDLALNWDEASLNTEPSNTFQLT